MFSVMVFSFHRRGLYPARVVCYAIRASVARILLCQALPHISRGKRTLTQCLYSDVCVVDTLYVHTVLSTPRLRVRWSRSAGNTLLAYALHHPRRRRGCLPVADPAMGGSFTLSQLYAYPVPTAYQLLGHKRPGYAIITEL